MNNYNTFQTSIGSISIEPTLEHATSYGGIVPLLDYLEKIKIKRLLEASLSLKKQNGTFPLSDVSLALILGRLLGLERISHFEDIEEETLLKRFFKWGKLPDYTTYYNDLKRFKSEEDLTGFEVTNQALTERVLVDQDRAILDFDSTVNTVYGNQQGAEVGYNSHNPGKKSLHPLLVFEGISRLCLFAELRNGKAYTSDGMVEAAIEALKHIPPHASIMARFDKGFPNDRHLSFFEEYRDPDTGISKEILYVGKLKLYKSLVKKGLEKNWCRVYEGTKIIEWTEIDHRAQTWSRSRRVILIRMAEASDFEEPYLSEEFLWEYQAIVTNMTDSGDEIWRFYNHRACMENYIKEAKNGFGADQVSGEEFYANFADLWLKMIAYNIHILFCKEVCVQAYSSFTISRFRRTFWEIPAILVTHARQWKLKMSNTFTRFDSWLKMLQRIHQLE
ncbi:IS1380 family transposase [Aquibacillus salsiterrae]|uniref:IS1380 family transposase n=1 Tax=Aquibacillus salsiterrae TaxID=2950439 RepID=A0A9X3WHV5_9BACI|nr:IS1380 family transposase [Aquibacillus salsiterrae]MDC3418755.1 IS1380 family transposase [Aquibacillus salsiterrae]